MRKTGRMSTTPASLAVAFALLQRQPLLRGAQVFSVSQIGDSYDYCSCTTHGY